MSDVPPATVPVEKPPEPTPVPAVTPSPDLPVTRDTLVTTVDANGQSVTASIGDMEKSWLGRGNQVTPEQKEKLELFEKAIEGGDPEASKALYARYLPQPETAPTVTTPDSGKIQELESKVDKLTALINDNVSPVVTQITEQARLHGITQEIAQGKHPLLAKTATGPQLVAAQRKHYEDLVRAKGHDPATIPEEYRQKIRIQSLQDVETFISGLLKDVGGVTRPVGPVSVNDQAVNTPHDNFRPARYQQKPDGAYVEVSRQETPLPAVPVTPASSGAAVGVRDETSEQGPMSLDQMRSRMGARAQTLSTIL